MLLNSLADAVSPSGFEGNVRNIIKNEIIHYVDKVKIDRMGNIIAHKIGPGKRVMLNCYIDEPAFIITSYNNDGTLGFESLGYIGSNFIPSKPVIIGENKIPGVIGLKPIHIQNKSERQKNVSYKDCCIDIGSNSKEETKKIIDLGDFAVFDIDFSEFGEGLIKGRSLKNRIGSAVIIEALKENYNCDLYATFNVQGEIGARGSYVSSFNVQPDTCIMLEGTSCINTSHKLGFGPVIPIMSKNNIFDTKIIESLVDIAVDNKIPYQKSAVVSDGIDSKPILLSGKGIRLAKILIPCKYMNSPISLTSLDDYENTEKVVIRYLKSL